MKSINQAFAEFNNILSKVDKNQFAPKIENIKNLINNNIGKFVNVEKIVYTGSISRKTAIPGKSDLDILTILGSTKPTKPPNEVNRDIDQGINNLISKDQLKGFVGTHAIYLPLAPSSLDVLLAYGQDPYWIPNRKEDKWVETSPSVLREDLIKVNCNNKNKVVPTIRYLKKWKQVTNQNLSSFELEKKIKNIFTNDKTLKDQSPVNILEVISDKLKQVDLHTQLIHSRKLAETDLCKGIKKYRKIFGDEFGK